jgi:hypothetical protein
MQTQVHFTGTEPHSFQTTSSQNGDWAQREEASHVLTVSPMLTSASGFRVCCQVRLWSNLQPSVRRLVLSHPLLSFVSADGGQNLGFCLKYFVIVVESGLAMGRNAEIYLSSIDISGAAVDAEKIRALSPGAR